MVPNGARLPDVCLKCGSHVLVGRRRHRFTWAPAWTYLAFVVGLIGALLVFRFQKKSSFEIPLCPACATRWDHANLALTGGALAILPYVSVIATASDSLSSDAARALFSFGLAAWVGVFTTLATRRAQAIVSAARIDAGYTHLEGLHPAAVSALCVRETIRHPLGPRIIKAA